MIAYSDISMEYKYVERIGMKYCMLKQLPHADVGVTSIDGFWFQHLEYCGQPPYTGIINA